MKQEVKKFLFVCLFVLLPLLILSCGGGGGGGDSGSSTPSTPTYTLSDEQSVFKKDYGYPEYLTISIDLNTGRREEAWVYSKLGKKYIYWDGKRVKEEAVTVAANTYSNPPYIDPTLFANATKKTDIQKLFGTNYTPINQSSGALSFLTWYYQSLGLSVSFSGDSIVVVQTIDKP
jgi:hypothetical protein